MYETFYGLTEKPFNLTPDPRFLYLSEKHKEAFAHLLYGIKNRSGFVMVTGEIGTGKTTICRTLLNQLDRDTEVAFIFNPGLSPIELLQKINEEFGIASQATTVKGLIDELNEYLLKSRKEGKNCVLVVDEAQNLSPPVLEQVRLLSNLETETEKLLQIVLIGQPELGESLAMPELRQLNQRITARYHLRELDGKETLQYVAYRIRVAGGRRKIRFTPSAIRLIYKASRGTPRVINAICDRALLIGYTQETCDITRGIVRQAVREIRGESFRARERLKKPSAPLFPGLRVAVLAAALVLAAAYALGPLSQWPFPNPGAVNRGAPAGGGPARAPEIVEAVGVSVEPVGAVGSGRPMVSELAVALNETPPGALVNAAALEFLRGWNRAMLSGYPEAPTAEAIAAFARENGLECDALPLSFDQALALNLPLYLYLTNDTAMVWVGLLRIEEDRAVFCLRPGDTLEAPLEEVRGRYLNRALVLWRDPEPNLPALRLGASGDAVGRLQKGLVGAGVLDESATGRFGEKTLEAVRRAQQSLGLQVDGIAGRQTRLALAAFWPGSHAPTLRKGGSGLVSSGPALASARVVPLVDGPAFQPPADTPVLSAAPGAESPLAAQEASGPVLEPLGFEGSGAQSSEFVEKESPAADTAVPAPAGEEVAPVPAPSAAPEQRVQNKTVSAPEAATGMNAAEASTVEQSADGQSVSQSAPASGGGSETVAAPAPEVVPVDAAGATVEVQELGKPGGGPASEGQRASESVLAAGPFEEGGE